jgi:hypothetical protein
LVFNLAKNGHVSVEASRRLDAAGISFAAKNAQKAHGF